jgi:hypothetical protein
MLREGKDSMTWRDKSGRPVEMKPSMVEISPFCVLGGISKSKEGKRTDALSDLIN